MTIKEQKYRLGMFKRFQIMKEAARQKAANMQVIGNMTPKNL